MDFNDFVVLLGNLIENAFEALLHVNKEEKKVFISIDQDEHTYLLLVEDNGIGIEEDKRTHPFSIMDIQQKTKANHGIGLYLINEIVKKANGTIEVTSNIGRRNELFILLFICRRRFLVYASHSCFID